MTKNWFNLIDEPWIPVVDVGRVSLKEIFSNPELKALGGNPIQKIALTKLLLAIAQSAHTPENDQSWSSLGAEGLAKACLAYLEQWHDRFYLYGENPFLQMPAIGKADTLSFGSVLPEIATGNTTVQTQIQQEKILDDGDKALLVLQMMGFGLAGKKTDNTVVLTPGYSGKTKPNGKPTSGKAGSSIGFMGYLHSFLQGQSIQQTLWLNLITQSQVAQLKNYQHGIGQAPWERMPQGEGDDVAKSLTQSLIGRMIPMGRFVLLTENALHYSEGIAHQDYKAGMPDPSASVNYSTKNPKAIWVDTEKRPWRMLTALLSFLAVSNAKDSYNCYQLEFTLQRALSKVGALSIWSGGLRVSSNAGEQYVSGTDDYVESKIDLPTSIVDQTWFLHLQTEMTQLDQLSKTLYGCVMSYYKYQLVDGKSQAAQATNLFWQLCESLFQELVFHVDDAEERYRLRKRFSGFVYQAFDVFCPKETARQLEAWAQSRPNLAKYLAKPDDLAAAS